MPTFSIRLTPEDSDAIRVLRKQGANITEIVRAALRSKAATLKPRKRDRKADIEALFARIDQIMGGKPMQYVIDGIDPANRKQASQYIRDSITGRTRRRLAKAKKAA
jgi:Arc/MetJ-type ribon-helix-helix transcriptional regulator